MRRGLLVAMSIFLMLFCIALPAAAESKQKGLLITPPRQYLMVDPGKTTKSSITIANLTENTRDVVLSVEQFSVADYTYAYTFDLPKENWVKLEQTQATLKKNESRTIAYTVAAPANAAPGGHYFSLFASTSLGEGRQVRAATVLYVTAAGTVSKQSAIARHAIPPISFGGDIPYDMDVKNTGNTHFIAYASGVMRGLLPFSLPLASEVAHIVLPATTRTIEGKMSPPLLPGLYWAVVGYRDEDGHEIRRTQYSFYMPPWFLVFIAGAAWFSVLMYKRIRKRPTGS